MTYELLERIAILEREKAELEKELHASVVERHDAEHIADAYKTERDIQRERAQAMHRRAQRAESELASLTKRTAAEIRTLNALVEGVQQNELHWLLQFLHCERLADTAMTEGLKECERLREESERLRESEYCWRKQWCEEQAIACDLRHQYSHLHDEVTKRDASLDNAFRMLATAEMREEAAKKRVSQLTEALEAAKRCYAGDCSSCPDNGCLVGIALGRIPAEVPNE